MDIFYKPPLQRPDECKALEENYINCLMQKALKDKVTTNKCVMDSILWFHTECPKAAGQFDDPNLFKLKFRRFFAMQRNTADSLLVDTEEEIRVQKTFGHTQYPEDMVVRPEVRAFPNEFKHLDPIYHPESEDDFENEILGINDEEIPKEDREYIDNIPGWPTRDTIEVSDSTKFSKQL